ncbi:hypothetical protein E9840_03290 [Tissierella creatinini]|nr:hypothetical protein E9840_03290 [Tissierella creatinini]TJX60697.1 hypothetical protein E8P77_19765 [Soehngenia saccharolytica]
MRKVIVSVFIALLLLSIIGCTTTEEEIEVLTGYIVLEDNALHFRHVEIVKIDEKDRMEELNLTEEDMPNGYAILRKNQVDETYELADEVEYIFTDVNLNFIQESEAQGNRLYTTTKYDEFLTHLGDLNNIPLSEQKIPYFIKIQDGKVIGIEEKFEYTI